MPVGIITHYASYSDEAAEDSEVVMQGNPCKTCGGTKRYVKSRACIECQKRASKRQFALKGKNNERQSQ